MPTWCLHAVSQTSTNTSRGAVDDETGKFSSDPKLTFKHPYPPTKIMFIPDKEGSRPDLLATTGDFLRIWQVGEDSVQMHKLLNNVRGRLYPPKAR